MGAGGWGVSADGPSAHVFAPQSRGLARAAAPGAGQTWAAHFLHAVRSGRRRHPRGMWDEGPGSQ